MQPILISFGPLKVYTYGVLLSISFIVGVLWSQRRARARNEDDSVIAELALVLFFAGILGARLLFVALHWQQFARDLSQVFDFEQIARGGMVLIGGLIAAICAAGGYFYFKKLSFLRYADIVTPALALGIALTRIGCFFNGCCFGLPTEVPWGCQFAPSTHAASVFGQSALVPAQLVASAGGLIITAMVVMLPHLLSWKKPGSIWWLFCALYGVHRFLLDMIRYYPVEQKFAGLTHNQWFSVGLIISSVIGGWFIRRKYGKN